MTCKSVVLRAYAVTLAAWIINYCTAHFCSGTQRALSSAR